METAAYHTHNIKSGPWYLVYTICFISRCVVPFFRSHRFLSSLKLFCLLSAVSNKISFIEMLFPFFHSLTYYSVKYFTKVYLFQFVRYYYNLRAIFTFVELMLRSGQCCIRPCLIVIRWNNLRHLCYVNFIIWSWCCSVRKLTNTHTHTHIF